jgi:hypothetical protein
VRIVTGWDRCRVECWRWSGGRWMVGKRGVFPGFYLFCVEMDVDLLARGKQGTVQLGVCGFGMLRHFDGDMEVRFEGIARVR